MWGQPDLRLPSPVQELDDDRLSARDVHVLVKRDDLIHSDLPGNKWRKLKYNLADATAAGRRTLLTFGGAHSNHIRAGSSVSARSASSAARNTDHSIRASPTPATVA